MSTIKVEEIDQIDLSHKNWWQPKIDRKEFKKTLTKILKIHGVKEIAKQA